MEPKTTRLSKNKTLLSYLPIRRGNWILQVSVFKNKNVLIIYNHYYDNEKFGLYHFDNYDDATKFIEHLISQE
jgi:hypothetical protein